MVGRILVFVVAAWLPANSPGPSMLAANFPSFCLATAASARQIPQPNSLRQLPSSWGWQGPPKLPCICSCDLTAPSWRQICCLRLVSRYSAAFFTLTSKHAAALSGDKARVADRRNGMLVHSLCLVV